MTLYQVAEVEDGELYYTEAFADCGVDLEGLSQEEVQDAAELLAVYAGQNFQTFFQISFKAILLHQ